VVIIINDRDQGRDDELELFWFEGRRRGIMSITFWGNNRKKGMLSMKIDDIFCPVGEVTIKSQERSQEGRRKFLP